MRAVLASAIIALAGYATARPLTVGDIAESAKSQGDTVSSGIDSSSSGSSAGSDGIDLSALGGSSSSSIPGEEDTDPLISSLNDNFPSDADLMEEEAGSSSRGINSGSGIGSSELDMKFGHLNVPASSSSSSSSGFDPTSGNVDVEDGDDDSSSLELSDLDVGNDLSMPRSDGFSDMSEEQLRKFVKYLALVLKENNELDADADADGFESSLDDDSSALLGDDESEFPRPVGSSFGDEPDRFPADGGSEIETEEPLSEIADPEDSQLPPDVNRSPFPNGRQLTPAEQAEFNAA